MKTNMRRLFSLSVMDSEYFNDKKNKIELVNCSREGMKCREHLLVINKNYLESDICLREKDYQRSIEKLKNAYYKSLELTDAPCLKCSELFRSTITDSLKGIKIQLEKLTTGFFGAKHYQLSYDLVNNVLHELEKPELIGVVKQKKSNERFIGSYLKKSAI